MGPVAKGRDAPKHSAAQRGKIGYCPCCVSATNVAIPGTYCLTSFNVLKHTGLFLWANGGPWAPRRPAAIGYLLRFNDRMPLPTGWDWAANSLEFAPPLAVVRGTFWGARIPIPTVTEAKAGPPRDRDNQREKGPQQPATESPFRLESLLPCAGPAQLASSSKGVDNVSPTAVQSKSGHLRGDHDTLSTGNYTGSPSAPSSWSSHRNKWEDWNKWKRM